jgi:hypothetical protein
MRTAERPEGQSFAVSFVLGQQPGIVWAYVSDLPELGADRGKWRQLFEDWRDLERACWRDGVMGWYCQCRQENTRMIRWVRAVGATPYGQDDDWIYFVKKILADPAGHHETLRALVRAMTPRQEAAHA